MADHRSKPSRVSGSYAKCGSKCQAKSIHASQVSFGAIIQAMVGTDPGEASPLVFLCCFSKAAALMDMTALSTS